MTHTEVGQERVSEHWASGSKWASLVLEVAPRDEIHHLDHILHATKTKMVAATAIPAHSNGNNIFDSLFL
jgi:hypothetical protein